MEKFVRTNGTLVNLEELLAVQHKPGIHEGVFREDEHYLLTFKTGQQIRLIPADGEALLRLQGCGGAGNGSDDTIATTSGRLI